MAVNAKVIQDGVLGMGLRGAPDTGLLRGFGVILAINTVDYLIEREIAFLNALPSVEPMAEKALVDAAQWCANATFGGMMKSAEWADLIAPMVKTKTDSLEALHAVQNVLGWGRIVDYELDEEAKTYTMRVKHSYYCKNYIDNHGVSTKPRCYMWLGVTAGNMDLVFGGKVNEFEGVETLCEAKGDDICEFKVRQKRSLFDLL
ncbi:MAG: V4R domain protein [candidate division Hyd24-12 bacterium ADurb.Bin004]|nr:MAG: V4R domain protein [candidate division Hyd24-12 bacterium ADurb.Bin004]